MDFERMKKLAGLNYITTEPKVLVEAEAPKDEYDFGLISVDEQSEELTEKLGSADQNEDAEDEDSKENQAKRLKERYRRAGISHREHGGNAEVSRKEQDDAFHALSSLLGGPHHAAHHLMHESVSVVESVSVDELNAGDSTPPPQASPHSRVKVPSDVTSAAKQRIAELKKAIIDFDEKGVNDGGIKQNAIDALEQILSDFGKPDGHHVAALFYGSLMSPIQDLLPPKLIKFIHASGPAKPVKEAFQSQRWYELLYYFPAGTEHIPGDWDAADVQSDGRVLARWDVPMEIFNNPSKFALLCKERGVPKDFELGSEVK